MVEFARKQAEGSLSVLSVCSNTVKRQSFIIRLGVGMEELKSENKEGGLS